MAIICNSQLPAFARIRAEGALVLADNKQPSFAYWFNQYDA